MNEHTKIYICTHCDFEPVVNNPVYEIADSRKFFPDGVYNGLRDSFYCELASYKYIHDNYELPDYIGFCGYRKYFSFMSNVVDIEKILNKYDVILSTPVIFNKTVYEQYRICHNIADLDLVRKIIHDKFPFFEKSFEDSLKMKTMFICNMFIMRKQDFQEYIQLVFDILDEFINAIGMDVDKRIEQYNELYRNKSVELQRSAKYQYKIGGFLGERITNAFYLYKGFKYVTFNKIETAKRNTFNLI